MQVLAVPSSYAVPLNGILQRRDFRVFVIFPVLLAVIYYGLFAADIYVSEVSLAVHVEHETPAMMGAGLLMPMLSQASNLQESYIVKEFIQSETMLDALEKDSLGLSVLYRGKHADFLRRLSTDATKEDYLDYFRRMNDVRYDERAGILYLSVRAFTPEDAKNIAAQILARAEIFVNDMSQRVHDDAVADARHDLNKAEDDILEQGKQLSDFRTQNQNFDPELASRSVGDIMSKLEEALAETNAEMAHAETFMKSDSPVVVALRSKANALRTEIDEQNQRLVSRNGKPLAGMAQSYAALSAKNDFAFKRYGVALAAYEAAQADARRQNIYLTRIQDPQAPQSAVEPHRLSQIFTIFTTSLIVYLIGKIMISSIMDHVRP